jgi:hypothetical protein
MLTDTARVTALKDKTISALSTIIKAQDEIVVIFPHYAQANTLGKSSIRRSIVDILLWEWDWSAYDDFCQETSRSSSAANS